MNSVPLNERDALSIRETCALIGISQSHFFNLQRSGLGPRTLRIGGRTVITKLARTEWLQSMEEKSDKN